MIFVPKSKFLPHRVWGDAESKIARNYYARSGTNSIPLNEGIVRSLYLTDGRVPKISVFTEPRIEPEGHISLNILAEPDSVYYVDRYYDSEKYLLLDEDGNIIKNEEDGLPWIELKHTNPQITRPIYPTATPILLFPMTYHCLVALRRSFLLKIQEKSLSMILLIVQRYQKK